MANQAQKKNKQTHDQWQPILHYGFLSLQAIYLVSIILAGVYFSVWQWLWFAFYYCVGQKSYKWILRELEQGIKPNYSLDVFAVVALSQLTNTVWSFGATLVLCAFQAYFVYYFGGWIL